MHHHEHLLQVGIMKFLRYSGYLAFAVPNGDRRDIKTATRLKSEGVLAGVADIVIVLPDAVVFVELKYGNGRQSASQNDFQQRVEALGHRYLLWRSLGDAIKYDEETRK